MTSTITNMAQEPVAAAKTAKLSVTSEKTTDAEDWPFEAGFNANYEQRMPVELTVTGLIPAYVRGVLFRTGPASYKVDLQKGGQYEFQHWFDGLTQVHQFKLDQSDGDATRTKVTYRSRRQVDELIEEVRKTGKFDVVSFGRKRDPCETLFRKVTSCFKPLMRPNGKSSMNIGVTMTANMPGLEQPGAHSSHSTKVTTLINKSDNGYYQKLDPETLEPVGVCTQKTLHPDLVGVMSAAHAPTCPTSGDVFNFNLDFGKDSTYRAFRASPKTGKVEILAKFIAPPTYLHSTCLTESTFIICIWNSRFKAMGLSVLYHRNIVDALTYRDKECALWYVIDRTDARRGIIATYTTPAFFCFHTINAYEEPSQKEDGKTDVVVDLCGYRDMSVLTRLYYNSILQHASAAKEPDLKQLPNAVSSVSRYRLPNVPIDAAQPKKSKKACTAHLEFEHRNGLELPTINRNKSTIKHRYIYGTRNFFHNAFIDGILKFDAQSGDTQFWSVHGHTPGEPIFIPDPKGEAEDDGVLLSVVLDGFAGTSYLLCLDAKNLQELGRAQVPGAIGFGFHGLHVPLDKPDTFNGGD